MPYYDRIGASEGIAVNKTGESKECANMSLLVFFKKRLKFQPYVCNRCHVF